ncbi:MAG TPA: hypothetical protein VLT83_07530 [Opitutaceae bacterium]|nr:hypothetical protein [Opitutaceae bacterium]
MTTPRQLLFLTALAFVSAGPAAAADIAGQWRAEFDTQIGLQKYVYAFTVVGDRITGRASFERENGKGEVDLKEIKLTGDDISFMEPLEFDGQQIRIDYHGKVLGDEMKLVRQVGDFATEDVVAKRVRSEPAPPKP